MNHRRRTKERILGWALWPFVLWMRKVTWWLSFRVLNTVDLPQNNWYGQFVSMYRDDVVKLEKLIEAHYPDTTVQDMINMMTEDWILYREEMECQGKT